MKRVAVLRGGPSEEYEVSMNTGKNVLEALNSLGYLTKDIVITKKGEWLDNGVVRTQDQALEAIDVAFIALHGAFGEDGKLQRILQRKSISFTGSGALASATAFNKELTKKFVAKHGILTPKHVVLRGDGLWSVNHQINDVYKDLGTELFIKPISSGSSVGASLVTNQEQLEGLLDDMLRTYGEVLIEEFIKGREATVGVLQNFRNQDLYVLPPIEIIPPSEASFFNKEVKYNGTTAEICPGNFSYSEKERMAEIASAVHKTIGCDHYSRSDFLLRNDKIYFLEVNTLPGLTNESLYPKAARAVGLEFNDLIQHLVETATA
jgi:D-alanine-D-alanine ligase